MKITIITAGWRKEGVENVIKSLNNQTYKEWEHIIVRDCSPYFNHDDLVTMCNGDPRRHWIDLGFNTGYYGAFARNIGVMSSFNYFPERSRKNDDDYWILFWDDDNDFYPDFLERMVKAHQDHPKAVLLGADIEIRGKINKEYVHLMKNKIYPQNTDLGAWLYRKDMIHKYGYFPASLRYKITYDWQLIKSIAEGEGTESYWVDPSGQPGLIFYHKER